MSDELETLRGSLDAGRRAALDRYVERVNARAGASLWSAVRFVAAPLAVFEGDAYGELLERVADTVALQPDDNRYEQYAVRTAALAPLAVARALLDGAHEVARAGGQGGWYVALVAEGVRGDVALAERAMAFARELAVAGLHPGYPFGTAIAALLARGEVPAAAWPVMAELARAAKDSSYGLFEYGVTGLAQGQLDGSDLVDALRLAIAMIDHGLVPGPTLQRLHDPVQLDVATKLANAGVDPALVIGNGIALFGALGWLEDGGERLTALAIDMHRRGLRQLLFDDGLDIVMALERDRGLGLRALELIEAMVARDLEPAIVMRWHLPRTLSFIGGEPAWAAAELLGLAEGLVAHGVLPDAAIGYAGRALVELASDEADFRRLAASVIDLVVRLHGMGVDYKDVLFHDVAHLAQAGQESQTFRELLAAMSELLSASTRGFEALARAVPAAAREAAGRPWVLAVALKNAGRLAKEGRVEDAALLLEVGVSTAVQVGEDAFEAALASVEARYAALPRELTTPASAAAGVLGGTDVARLDQALAVIGEAYAVHGAAIVERAAALPDLARIAGAVEALPRMIEASLARQLGEHAVRAAAVVAQVCRGADAGCAALADVAKWIDDDGARGKTLGAIGSLARVATPVTLVAVLEALHGAFSSLEDRRMLVAMLEHARTETNLRRMCELVPPVAGARDALYHARDLVARSSGAWEYLVAPALAGAKLHAGPLLQALTWLPAISAESDLAVLRDVIAQRGVRAVDLVANLIEPALRRGVIDSLAGHAELLERYLRDVGFADAEVYAAFVGIAHDPTRVAALRGEISELVASIRAGQVPEAQRKHALFAVALQHVFPAAVSATRQHWRRLVEVMADRPGDVTALVPADAVSASIEVAAGAWQLVADVDAADLAPFAWCARVLPQDDAAPRELAILGWELLTAWSEGRLAREKTELTRELLRHATPLPSGSTDSAAQLLAIKSLAADKLSSLIESAVIAARDQDPDRARRLVHARLAPPPRIGAGLVKAVAKTLSSGLDAATTLARLRSQLAAFEVADDAPARLSSAPDLAAALHALPAKDIAIEAGKELGRIHADLVGQELAGMTAALARVLEYRASSDVVRLQTTVTKRDVHAPIGLTAGVCVAGDVQLWNTPTFLHLALWDGDVCAGDVHLLVVDDHLALPGINPSSALLDRVEADVLLRALLDRCRALARAANLAGVWIPASPGIHSNRRAIHDALLAMKLPERRTAGYPFSYSPYAYRIEDVLEA